MRLVPATACVLLQRLGQPGCGACPLVHGTPWRSARQKVSRCCGGKRSVVVGTRDRTDGCSPCTRTAVCGTSTQLRSYLAETVREQLSDDGTDGPSELRDDARSGTKRAVCVHLIVLVHGWLGNHRELAYTEASLRRQSRQWRCKGVDAGSETVAPNRPEHRFVVHNIRSNVDRTTDGIEAGGERVAQEIDALVSQVLSYLRSSPSPVATPSKAKGKTGDGAHDDDRRADNDATVPIDGPTVSLSLVGNSLGGLYGRYALAQIRSLADASLGIVPAVFCTTATPHLGVSRNTWLPLPRALETIIGQSLQTTGRDLFCLTDVVHDLCTESQFLDPLSKFRRRVAHANAFGTDFMVPTATAGFLTPDGNSLHTVKENKTRTMSSIGADAAQLRDHVVTVSTHGRKASGDEDATGDEVTLWADRLDSLGWEKVFWDVRTHLPSLPFLGPTGMDLVDRRQRTSAGTTASASQKDESKSLTSSELFHVITGATTTSRSSARAMSMLSKMAVPPTVPYGHTMLVANSKNALVGFINKGGRSIMDHLAASVLQDIVSCCCDDEDDQANG